MERLADRLAAAAASLVRTDWRSLRAPSGARRKRTTQRGRAPRWRPWSARCPRCARSCATTSTLASGLVAAFRRARGVALLARWLGPWTRADAAPRGVERHVVREGASRCDVYRPARRAEGALLVVHGVHFHGPDDPRFERFARVLAGTRLVVVAPEVRSYRALMPDASAGEDIGVAAALTEREAVQLGTKPAGFSISFGCLGMLNAIAARDGGGWAGVMPFGGFADWRATTRFAFTGRLDDGTAAPNDPLARPVMAIRLAEELAEEGVNVAEVREAWRRFVHQTWCDEAMAEGDAWIEPARNIGSALAAPERGLYELGLGLRAEATEAIEAALSARDWSELDPRLAAGALLSCLRRARRR